MAREVDRWNGTSLVRQVVARWSGSTLIQQVIGDITATTSRLSAIKADFTSDLGAFVPMGGLSVVGGRARLVVNSDYTTMTTAQAAYSLLGDTFHVEFLPGPMPDGAAFALAQVCVESSVTAEASRVRIEVNWASMRIQFADDVWYSDAGVVEEGYDATAMRWLRFREADGTLYWETSPTGADGTWTVRRQKARPAWMTAAADVRPTVTTNTNSGTSYIEVDNVNTVPGTTSPPASGGETPPASSGGPFDDTFDGTGSLDSSKWTYWGDQGARAARQDNAMRLQAGASGGYVRVLSSAPAAADRTAAFDVTFPDASDFYFRTWLRATGAGQAFDDGVDASGYVLTITPDGTFNVRSVSAGGGLPIVSATAIAGFGAGVPVNVEYGVAGTTLTVYAWVGAKSARPSSPSAQADVTAVSAAGAFGVALSNASTSGSRVALIDNLVLTSPATSTGGGFGAASFGSSPFGG